MSEKFGLCMLIVITYSIYMIGMTVSGQPVPDGLLMSGVIGSILYVFGYNTAKTRITAHYEASECQEPSLTEPPSF